MKQSRKSKRRHSSSQKSEQIQRRRKRHSSSSRSPSQQSHKKKKKSHKSKHHHKDKKRHRQSRSKEKEERQKDLKVKIQEKQPKYNRDSQSNRQQKYIQKNQQQQELKRSPISQQQSEQKQFKQDQQNPPTSQRQLPCFEPSGILLQYYNTREGVSLRFHEPPQSRQPQEQWRMYIFKGEQVLKPIILTKSCYLIGKDERVVDILAQNSSISRQHAVIQFRLVQKRQTQGEYVQSIKPYLMDLQSTNGTSLNDEKIEPGRYYELLHRDVVKFGFSDREYVLVKWEGGEE